MTSEPAQLAGQFLVNVPAVTDREDPDDTSLAIQLVNHTKPSDGEFRIKNAYKGNRYGATRISKTAGHEL